MMTGEAGHGAESRMEKAMGRRPETSLPRRVPAPAASREGMVDPVGGELRRTLPVEHPLLGTPVNRSLCPDA